MSERYVLGDTILALEGRNECLLQILSGRVSFQLSYANELIYCNINPKPHTLAVCAFYLHEEEGWFSKKYTAKKATETASLVHVKKLGNLQLQIDPPIVLKRGMHIGIWDVENKPLQYNSKWRRWTEEDIDLGYFTGETTTLDRIRLQPFLKHGTSWYVRIKKPTKEEVVKQQEKLKITTELLRENNPKEAVQKLQALQKKPPVIGIYDILQGEIAITQVPPVKENQKKKKKKKSK